jgi:hypothetical protein
MFGEKRLRRMFHMACCMQNEHKKLYLFLIIINQIESLLVIYYHLVVVIPSPPNKFPITNYQQLTCVVGHCVPVCLGGFVCFFSYHLKCNA